MTDSLSKIFIDSLFKTKKSPKRDWMIIADRSGGQLYSIVCEEFQHPEVALCALIHSIAQVVACQPDDSKREKLLKCLPDAITDCMSHIEKAESDEPYEYESDEGPGRPEDEEEEVEMDPADEVDFSKSSEVNPPERPSPEPVDDNDPMTDDDDPNESRFKTNPARMAGFKKKGDKRS